MTWYKTGLASVTNGDAIVVGTGTAWIANARAGDVFIGPDFSTYEILAVNSDIGLTLASPYRGATGSGAYAIQPTSDYVRALTSQVSALLAYYAAPTYPVTPAGGVLANAEFIGVDPLTGVGDDVQEALARLAQMARNTVVLTEARFGAVDNTGVADCRAAFTAAIAATGSDIILPPGTYRVVIPAGSSNGISMAGKRIRIRGFGREHTKIIFEPADATQRFLFRTPAGSEGFELSDLTAELVNPNAALCTFFSGPGVSHLRVRRCNLLGGITHADSSGETISHQCYGIMAPTTGTFEDFLFEDVYAERMTWFNVQSNTDTSTTRKWRFVRCEFAFFYRAAMNFNAPLGVSDDIEVTGCLFRDSQGIQAGNPEVPNTPGVNVFHLGFACCSNVRATLNRFTGQVDAAIHVEAKVHRGTISHNIIDNDGRAGIEFLDNNLSGARETPEDLVIAHNIVRKAGTQKQASTFGIYLINDTGFGSPPKPSFTPGRRLIIQGNNLSGWGTGITNDAGLEDGCDISGNIAFNCGTGFNGSEAATTYNQNRSVSCDIGVAGSQGIVYRNHGFTNCGATAQDNGRRVLLINPYWEWTPFETTGAAVDRVLVALTANARIDGEISTLLVSNVLADTEFQKDSIRWDGANYERNPAGWPTRSLETTGGGLAVSHQAISGNLVTRVSGAARTGVRVTTHMRGEMLVAA